MNYFKNFGKAYVVLIGLALFTSSFQCYGAEKTVWRPNIVQKGHDSVKNAYISMVIDDGEESLFQFKGLYYSPVGINYDPDKLRGGRDLFWDVVSNDPFSKSDTGITHNFNFLWLSGSSPTVSGVTCRGDLATISKEIKANCLRIPTMTSRLLPVDGSGTPYIPAPKDWYDSSIAVPITHSEFLDACQKAGLYVLIDLKLPKDLFYKPLYDSLPPIAIDEKETLVDWWIMVYRELLEELGSHPAVAGFIINHETSSLLYAGNESTEFQTFFWDQIRTVSKDVKSRAPEKLLGVAFNDLGELPAQAYSELANCPNVDFWGLNIHQPNLVTIYNAMNEKSGRRLGWQALGSKDIRAVKPVLLTQFGIPLTTHGEPGNDLDSRLSITDEANHVHQHAITSIKDLSAAILFNAFPLCGGMFYYEFSDEWWAQYGWTNADPTTRFHTWHGGFSNPTFPGGYNDLAGYGLFSLQKNTDVESDNAPFVSLGDYYGPDYRYDTLNARNTALDALSDFYSIDYSKIVKAIRTLKGPLSSRLRDAGLDNSKLLKKYLGRSKRQVKGMDKAFASFHSQTNTLGNSFTDFLDASGAPYASSDTSKYLYLNFNNLTVGEDGKNASGYGDDEIYLTIQGKQDDGNYYYLDWETFKWKEMSDADNTKSFKYLGLNSSLKYATYGQKLSEIKKKKGYDKDNGILIPVPIFGARTYISFGKPMYMTVISAKDKDTGKTTVSPAEPNEALESDPNYTTVWDKFEFTADASNVLYSNTTRVDFVGIPSSYNVTQNGVKIKWDGENTEAGFNIPEANRADPLAYVTTDFLTDEVFKVLVGKYRLFAPKVKEEGSTRFLPLGYGGDYMDKYIDYCWAHYHTTGDSITIWNFVDVDDNNKSVKWTATGTMVDGAADGKTGTLTFQITELLKTDGSKLPVPTDKFTIPHPPSWDILAQGGVIKPDDKWPSSSYKYKIDGDIKNQVSCALNRCVMHGEYKGYFDQTNHAKGEIMWADTSVYYHQNDVPDDKFKTNKYAEYLHKISVGNKCYALAYDDKYSQNVNISTKLNDTPTVMNLSVYYLKKPAPTINKAELKTSGDKVYTISVKEDSSNSEAAVLTLSPPRGTTLKSAKLIYVPADFSGSSLNVANFTSAIMNKENNGDFTIEFLPDRFDIFKFYLDVTVITDTKKGTTASGFLPTNAMSAGKGHGYQYDYTKSEDGLTADLSFTTQLPTGGLAEPPGETDFYNVMIVADGSDLLHKVLVQIQSHDNGKLDSCKLMYLKKDASEYTAVDMDKTSTGFQLAVSPASTDLSYPYKFYFVLKKDGIETEHNVPSDAADAAGHVFEYDYQGDVGTCLKKIAK